MKCPKCHHANPAKALFCGVCGTELPEQDSVEMPSMGEAPTLREDAEPLSVGELPTLRDGGEMPSLGDLPTLRDGVEPGGAAGPLGTRRFKGGEKLMRRYEVLGELGQGGMGVVYRCKDVVGGIEVALKALPPELSHNSGEMEEVRENFQLVCQLAHPHIATVRTLELDAQTGNYYLILELAEGVDLRKWRKQQAGGKVPLPTALPILKQIAQALDYAHSRKIIHRDIKPGNVIVGADGTVKVLDFGLAAQIQSGLSRVSQVHYSTSGTGTYMAPEQWRGQRQDGRTDQYALAVMAYEMLSGHLPFESLDPVVLKHAVLDETAQQVEGISDGVWKVLLRGMAKEPGQRFGSCGELVEALGGKGKEVRSQKPEVRSPESAIGNRKSKMPLLVVLAVGLVLAGVGGWYFGVERPRQTALTTRPAEPGKNETAAKATSGAQVKAENDAKEKALAQQSSAEQQRLAVEAKAKADAEAEQKRVAEAAAAQERERLANAQGGLLVKSAPSGATVTLGAVEVLTTPATFKGVKIGKYPLKINLDGYEIVNREVEVKENEFADLGTVSLVRQTGSVKITSEPSGATVLQGGKELGTTPLLIDALPTGANSFSVTLAGYKSVSISGNVVPKNTIELSAHLQPLMFPTGDTRWTNSLGMIFMPVPGTKTMFCIWKTRRSDFEYFVAATGYDAGAGMYSLRNDGWKQRGDSWKSPGFNQASTHPVCGVNWEDATAFCKWLTETEQNAGRLAPEQAYRLPADAEWSKAVGLNGESGGNPKQKNLGIDSVYPWGTAWPPPAGAGNYAGEESKTPNVTPNWSFQTGFNDGYPRTSPVGAFAVNRLGLYDLGGNLWEWCQDSFDGSTQSKVLRGASWNYHDAVFLAASRRVDMMPTLRFDYVGFRCVIEIK